MLTIKNIEKLFRQDVGDWRISGVETLKFTYLIHLKKSNGETHQINIERLEIGQGGYEMWCWKTKHSIKNMQGSATSERFVLVKGDLMSMGSALNWLNRLIQK